MWSLADSPHCCLNPAWSVLRVPPTHLCIFFSFICLFCLKISTELFFRGSSGWHGYICLLHSLFGFHLCFLVPNPSPSVSLQTSVCLVHLCLSVTFSLYPHCLSPFLSFFVLLSFFVSVSMFLSFSFCFVLCHSVSASHF